MFKVSDKAAAALHDALDANESIEPELFRLSATLDGIDLAIGEQQTGDQLVTHDERRVLAIESDAADALDGATLDAVDTEEGPRLVLEAPDAPGTDAAAH